MLCSCAGGCPRCESVESAEREREREFCLGVYYRGGLNIDPKTL